MEFEEIQIGDVFMYEVYEETVISKSDEYKIITTIDSNMVTITWKENDLHLLKPIKEKLPEEGLLVSKRGSLVYKLSDGSGYGFAFGEQSDYIFNKGWEFSTTGHWKPATSEEEEKFIKMLKIECCSRGLLEDTRIETHADVSKPKGALNKGEYHCATSCKESWNKNGQIFHKGVFATPLKEVPTLDLVSKVVQEIDDFTIEQTESGVIILTPIKK